MRMAFSSAEEEAEALDDDDGDDDDEFLGAMIVGNINNKCIERMWLPIATRFVA